MRRAVWAYCAVLAAGAAWLAADLAASPYHWHTSLLLSTGHPAAQPSVFPQEGPVIVLVHKDNPVENLTLGQLARIYRGEVIEWPDGTPITAINRPIQSEVRERFYRIVLNTKPTQKFFHAGSPIPFETQRVDSEQAIPRFVSRDRSAIAYCYASCSDTTVKVLRIGGHSPDEEGYALR